MKDYDSGKPPQSQVHLLGLDCQFVDYNKALIEDYLKTYGNGYPDYIDSILEKISSLTYQDGTSISDAEKSVLKSKCDSVYAYLESNRNSLIAKSGEFDYDIILRLLEQSKQFLDVITETSVDHRDYYMAQNAIWMTTLLGGNTKVMLWAHNGYVGRNQNSYNSMGYTITQEIGNNYKVIGFSFNQGKFRAVNYDQNTNQYTGLTTFDIERLPIEGSYNYIFQAANPKDFILVFSNVPNSTPLYNWLNSSRPFMMIGAVYSKNLYSIYYSSLILEQYFDAIIHFQRTNASTAFP